MNLDWSPLQSFGENEHFDSNRRSSSNTFITKKNEVRLDTYPFNEYSNFNPNPSTQMSKSVKEREEH